MSMNASTWLGGGGDLHRGGGVQEALRLADAGPGGAGTDERDVLEPSDGASGRMN